MSRNTCLLCSSESEFNILVTSNYSRKTNLLCKIQVCLNINVNEDDIFNAVCHRCVHNIEEYYGFIMNVKKATSSLDKKRAVFTESCDFGPSTQQYICKSYVHEQVMNYSYFDTQQQGETENTKKKNSSAMFSSLSPEKSKEPPMNNTRNFNTQPEKYSFGSVPKEDASVMFSFISPIKSAVPHMKKTQWNYNKTQPEKYSVRSVLKGEQKYRSLPHRQESGGHVKRYHYPKICSSRDIFESPNTQDVEERNTQDLKLTPDDNIMKKLCNRHFGSSDF